MKVEEQVHTQPPLIYTEVIYLRIYGSELILPEKLHNGGCKELLIGPFWELYTDI